MQSPKKELDGIPVPYERRNVASLAKRVRDLEDDKQRLESDKGQMVDQNLRIRSKLRRATKIIEIPKRKKWAAEDRIGKRRRQEQTKLTIGANLLSIIMVSAGAISSGTFEMKMLVVAAVTAIVQPIMTYIQNRAREIE